MFTSVNPCSGQTICRTLPEACLL